METEIMSASGVGLQVGELLTPFIIALVSLVVTLWFKDYATKIAKGMAFQMNKSFGEGDKVILDGEKALIVKIGLTETVFGITKENGDYHWRFVPNERIPILKLEKVIFDNTPHENGAKTELNKEAILENKAMIEEILNREK
jgi:small-conductance mechanosensitive channel|tara:strand:- start:717 stop:1142 length:426 start_codon:yes stop_codon:yes gene_type:complete